ncbi:glycosyl transferase, group 1 [Magnetococcus marinus MC-1]|uniref:Glycosyl transferase, group 1 n=2 Tax=Magnetococcus TaxID=162171 RepID=A0LA01_MAGMM|nr:glycosyl transferase, group 1 [Magnetococcus marinus MC-1]
MSIDLAMRQTEPHMENPNPTFGRNKRILIATDAWDPPQVNGVALTYQDTVDQLRLWGDHLEVIHPRRFEKKWFTLKGDNVEMIRDQGLTARLIESFQPEHIHIATEGPIGMAACRYCRNHHLAFTTTYHTQWPEYAQRRSRGLISSNWVYPLMRRFHNRAACIMATTPPMADMLKEKQFNTRIALWMRGVDTQLFRPRPATEKPEILRHAKGPIYLYVGRLAREKNLDPFIHADVAGTKVLVGEGPDQERLQRLGGNTLFAGLQRGEALARFYAAADVFVFPSLTDTFGKVLIEALASGTPIAAFHHLAPAFVLGQSGAGVMHDDLKIAMLAARQIDPLLCLKRAADFSIAGATAQFRNNLVPCAAG